MPDTLFGPIFIHAASFCYELVVEVMAVVMVIVVVAVVVVEKSVPGTRDVKHLVSLPISIPFWTCCLHL